VHTSQQLVTSCPYTRAPRPRSGDDGSGGGEVDAEVAALRDAMRLDLDKLCHFRLPGTKKMRGVDVGLYDVVRDVLNRAHDELVRLTASQAARDELRRDLAALQADLADAVALVNSCCPGSLGLPAPSPF
jgi:hypothetical protein